ncbi:MAG: 23S rRNA (pseudouridine(1915)-N(3))-methyltransferase RlmH [Oligoflexales bacterium]|nr:23S rRNA (pseudouridine(1915)-N(3))-methyltransferase RlmH [Oligoflexales bacterium]
MRRSGVKIEVFKLGRLKQKALALLIEDYFKRLSRIWAVSLIELKEKHSERQIEVPKSLQASLESSFIVCLDECGHKLNSLEFAQVLQNWLDDSAIKKIVFVIGGAFGIPQAILQRANYRMSFSDLTFTSDHAWLILWEQLYRASTIHAGTSYHHGDSQD